MTTKKILITGALVADGTGTQPAARDILISGSKIMEVAETITSPDADRFDAARLIAAPGFIDIHAHGDFDRLVHPVAEEKVRQGCTMEVVGNCGLTPFPYNKTVRDALQAMIATIVGTDFAGFPRFRDYASFLEERGLAINLASYVGQGIIRGCVMGTSSEPAGDREFSQMERLIEESVEDGVIGVSTGLIYPTGSMTGTNELTRLMKSAARMKRGSRPVYATHIRNEGKDIHTAIEEAITIGTEAGCPVQISHLKCQERSNWGRSIEVIERVTTARSTGLDITADMYPYLFLSTLLAVILTHPEGDPATIIVSKSLRSDGSLWEEITGRSLAQIAESWSVSPQEAGATITSGSPSTLAVGEFMHEDDLVNFMRQPWVFFGSDGIEDRVGKPHPRVTGTFPRVLARYVREKGVLSWGEAIAKMTGRPAARLGLTDRGIIGPGYSADITLFDPDMILDNSTYTQPHLAPTGIPHVMVNGAWALRDGALTGAMSGRILRPA
jgi:N-acyl-D-aspartate/D-glutamate deacylase